MPYLIYSRIFYTFTSMFLNIILMKKILFLMAFCFALLPSAFAFTIQLYVKNSTCGNNNGSIEAIVIGASPPITYLWSDGQTTTLAANLAPGVYTVVITDAFSTDSASATVVDDSFLSGGDLSYIIPPTGSAGAT